MMHHEALRTCLMRCRSVGVLRRKTAGAALKPARYYQTGALLLGQCATRPALIDRDLRLVLLVVNDILGRCLFLKIRARAVGSLRPRPPLFLRGALRNLASPPREAKHGGVIKLFTAKKIDL